VVGEDQKAPRGAGLRFGNDLRPPGFVTASFAFARQGPLPAQEPFHAPRDPTYGAEEQSQSFVNMVKTGFIKKQIRDKLVLIITGCFVFLVILVAILLVAFKGWNILLCVFVIASAIAIFTLLNAIIDSNLSWLKITFLIGNALCSILIATVTYFVAMNTVRNAAKLNKATKLSIILDSYPAEIQRVWIEEENELKAELDRSKAEEADKVLAIKAWSVSSDYFQRGEIKPSLEFLDYSLFFVETGIAHTTKAMILWGTKPKEAIREDSLGIKLNPEAPIGYNNLGQELISFGDTINALNNFRIAVEKDPTYAKGHYNLGNALGHLGKFEEEIKELHLAIKSDSTFPLSYFNLGHRLAEQGKFRCCSQKCC